MPSDATSAVLRDIAHHIDLAADFATGLEIISEASRRLPPELKARHPSIPWRNMAAAGNVYRHDYEDVDARQVWDAVQRALPPLRAMIAHELAAAGHP